MENINTTPNEETTMENQQRKFWIEERDRNLAAIQQTEARERTMATVDALAGFRRDVKLLSLAIDSINGCTDEDFSNGCKPFQMLTSTGERTVAFAFDAKTAEYILRKSIDGLVGSASPAK